MKKYANSYKLFIFLLIFWFVLSLNFALESIIAGILICGLVTILSYKVLYIEKMKEHRHIGFKNALIYVFVLFYEIYKSSIIYVINIITKKHTPMIVDITLDVDDPLIISFISNSITLTPGTITIETDGKHLTVLTLAKSEHTKEEVEQTVKGKFEYILTKKENK